MENKFILETKPVGFAGRVVIPFPIREAMDIKESDVLLFKYNRETEQLIVSKVGE